MKSDKLFTSQNIKNIALLGGFIAFIIMILTNFSFNNYIKYFLLPMFLLLFFIYHVIKQKKLIVNSSNMFYIIPLILILSISLITKIDISNQILNIIIVPILMTIFFLSLINPYFNLKLSFNYTLDIFGKNYWTNLKYLKLVNEGKQDNTKINGIIKKIFLGLLISLPLTIVLLFLLASADYYFATFLTKIKDNVLEVINYKKVLFNLLILGIYFLLFFGSMINIFLNRKKEIKLKIKKPLDKTIASTILIIVNIIFSLFLVSEISKLAGNFLNLPLEYTYAKYAREGFFQLLFVTVINLGLIFYFLYNHNINQDNKLVKFLLLLLSLFSIILIFNSYYRMFLYIKAYGLTVLRLQVILFLGMELFIFGFIIIKIFKKKEINQSLAFYFLLITTYILNLIICTEPMINWLNSF